tara:strand:- start:4806 stop:5429 length:624 start_codon:yes stop_codon:yes gene_type:complete
MWGDYENETLIHNHKMAKIYKKRYQRAGDFNNSLYNLFGLITVVSSTIASTISWGKELDSEEHIILSSITTISAISAAIQSFCKFQENSNTYFKTAKFYAKLQNKIEGVGNIHPEYRTKEPILFFKKVQNQFDQISDNRLEISNCMTKLFYNKKNDDSSYLEEKHEKYKVLTDTDKLNFAKNAESRLDSDISEEDDEIDEIIGSNIS